MKFNFLGLTFGINKKAEINQNIVIDADVNTSMSRLWKVSDDRRQIELDIDRMLDEDVFSKRGLDILVEDCIAVKSPFDPWVEIISKDESLKNRIAELHKLAGIQNHLKNIYYKFLGKGNCFGELLFAQSNPGARSFSINNFRGMAIATQPWSIFRNQDEFGQLLTGNPIKNKRVNFCAYDQRDSAGNYLAGFLPFEIWHIRQQPVDKDGYGTPYARCGRRNWLRLQYVEDGMGQALIMRAYSKNVHLIPCANDATPEEKEKLLKLYKDSVSRLNITGESSSVFKRNKLLYPTDVASDWYLFVCPDIKGDIKILDPSNPQLQNLKPIEYFQNAHLALSGVPKARMGLERDINAKATLTEQDKAYAKTIYSHQYDFLMGLIDLTNCLLMLDGIDPEKTDYQLVLPSPFVRDELEQATINKIDSEAAALRITHNISSADRERQDLLGMDEKASAEEQEKILGEKDIFPQAIAFGNQIPTEEMTILQQIRKMVEDQNGHKHISLNRIKQKI